MCLLNMLPEIPYKISQEHVLYEETCRFGSACKSWQSAAETKLPNDKNGPSSRFPALLLAEKTEDVEFRELFLLSNKKISKIRLPLAYGKFCLSSRGLLATVGDDHAVKLVNPLLHDTINLPSLDTFPISWDTLDWEGGISKLLVTSMIPTLGIVVVLWGGTSKLGFCRPENTKWTPIVTGWVSAILDITYYNNRVYCFDGRNCIRTCDIYGDNPTVMVMVSKLPRDLYDGDKFGAYIVGFEDDDARRKLLVSIREPMWLVDDGGKTICMTKGFKVFDYDFETKIWSNVKDLGRKTLFVGYSSTFWIEGKTGVIEENCIYYTEHEGLECGRDMGIYHMSDGTIEPHYGGESLSNLTPPIWLQTI